MNFDFNCRSLKGEDRARVLAYSRMLFDVFVGEQPPNTNVYIKVCGKAKRYHGLSIHNPRSSKCQWFFVTVAKSILDESEARYYKVLIHELVHCRQFVTKELDCKRKYVYWRGERYITPSGINALRDIDKLPKEEYDALPWEHEAREHEERVYGYLVATTILTSALWG